MSEEDHLQTSAVQAGSEISGADTPSDTTSTGKQAKKTARKAVRKKAPTRSNDSAEESANSGARESESSGEDHLPFDPGERKLASQKNEGGYNSMSTEDKKPERFADPQHHRPSREETSHGNSQQNQRNQSGGNRQGRNRKKKNKQRHDRGGSGGGGGGGGRRGTPFSADGVPVETDPLLELGQLPHDEFLQNLEALDESFGSLFEKDREPANFNSLYGMPLCDLRKLAEDMEISFDHVPSRLKTLQEVLQHWQQNKQPIVVEGTLEVLDDGFGMILQSEDSYRIRALSPFVSEALIEHHGLMRGHSIRAYIQAPRENESCPVVLKVDSVMESELDKLSQITPFTELVPYYPLERILLENSDIQPENNLSMRIVDLISPIGFGQRGLIVAPPRTGKTVILQGIANAVQLNYPNAHLIVLLIDERPEEVTDFRRKVEGEVVSSTFDESAGSHVHAAEMVIEKARRMVEIGRDVVILLDSITRLARAYNTLMPNSGKILSGGVEANALQKPKRFFGSARNIEAGGSLTIMGTALVETGSKMDEVIFEEFKGTGNMELHLDRGLVEKRVFPALAMDKSGTRKEELLYHPDEMQKVFSLRRATRGVPPVEAMEMLIQRIKKTNSNAEFLMTLNR